MAEDTENMEAPKAEEIQVESIEQPTSKKQNEEKKSLPEIYMESTAKILSSSKEANSMSASRLLMMQKQMKEAYEAKDNGSTDETIKKLTSYKAQKNLNNSVLGILEKVAAGVPLIDGSVDNKVKGSDATVWETYKARKALILSLIDNAPEDFKTNFKSTIEMVNRRLNPTDEQKPTVKLYKGDLKKGFINSVIYNNFYASNSWGKKNIIHPWRKFKRSVRKTFEPSYATKLARLQRRNNKMKRKLWRQEKWNAAKNWVKSRPSWLNEKRKEYGGKIANWFKEKTWVGKKLVQANKWRKETGLKIKNKAIEIGNKAWNVTKTVGHAIKVGAKYAALGATAPIWGVPYLAYKGAKAAGNWTKTKYNNVKNNVKESMQATIDRSAEDRDKYSRRNPHPYKGKDPVYTMSEEDQKKIDMALNAYTNQARPTQEVEMQNGNIVTRKDTTKWMPDDVERQAASEMLGKLLQSKDNGGLELPKEQAKEIIDFFNKQGLMKSTYDNIAKDESINKPLEKEVEQSTATPEVTKGKGSKSEENSQEVETPMQEAKPLEERMKNLGLDAKQTAEVMESLAILKECKENNDPNLEKITKLHMQHLQEHINIPEEKIAQIKEMNPDLFPKKEQEADKSKGENTIDEVDEVDGIKVVRGTGKIEEENKKTTKREKISEDKLLAQIIAEDKEAGRTGMDSKLYRYQEAKRVLLAETAHYGKGSAGAEKAANQFKKKLTKDIVMKKDKDGKETNINEAIGLDPKLANQFITVLEGKGILPKKKAKQQSLENAGNSLSENGKNIVYEEVKKRKAHTA